MSITINASRVGRGSDSSTLDTRIIACLLVVALASRLLVFSLTINEYGDPDARALWGSFVHATPFWITSGFWLPLHPYLIALLMVPLGDPLLAGRMLSLSTGVAAIVPFYLLARVYFDRRTSGLAGLLFALYGLHVGLSAIVMTETTFVFLGLCALLLFARELQTSTPRFWMLSVSAVLLSLAGGFRHEAWQLTGILMLWLILDRRTRRYAPGFALIGFSFFALWTLGNVLAGNGILYSLTGVASQKARELALVQHSAVSNLVKWGWIAVESPGPLVSALGLAGVWLGIRRGRLPMQLAWVSLLMLAPYLVLSIVKTEWRPQQRYVVFMATLLLPYAAAAFWHWADRVGHARRWLVLLLVITVFGQGAAYSRTSEQFLPVRSYQRSDVELWSWLRQNLEQEDRIVVEDLDWRSPGIILHSERWRRPYRTVFPLDPPERMKTAIDEADATVLVLASDGSRWPDMGLSALAPLYRNADYRVIRLRNPR